MSTIPPPLKWHGGKHYLAKRIIALMPRHVHYVEPYAGGLAVLLARDPADPALSWGSASHARGVSEVVNDISAELINFWRVLQDRWDFEQFRRIVQATPFAQMEFERARAVAGPGADRIHRAAVFFVQCRQSLAGRMQGFAALSRTRTRRGMNEQASAWLSAVDGLPAVHERLRRVVILCDDALNVIRQQDGPRTLFYCDPPYLHSTRTSADQYQHEMTEQQHLALLKTLAQVQGRLLLSGYPSALYDSFALAQGWSWVDFDLPNHAAGGQRKRRMTERIWANYPLGTA